MSTRIGRYSAAVAAVAAVVTLAATASVPAWAQGSRGAPPGSHGPAVRPAPAGGHPSRVYPAPRSSWSGAVYVGRPYYGVPYYSGFRYYGRYPYYGAYGYYGVYPYFGPPYYGPTYVPVPTEPPVYIERAPGEGAEGGAAPAQGWWYWCADPQGYYPSVRECPGGWQPVAPQPATNP